MKYDPKLDFEQTIEKTLLDLRRRFYVREVRYDPYQLVAVAQRLTQQGLPMTEFAQSVPNLTEASTNLYGEPRPPRSWQRFTQNTALLARYHVTTRELQVLEHLSLLGTAISTKEFLAILTLIRDIPERE